MPSDEFTPRWDGPPVVHRDGSRAFVDLEALEQLEAEVGLRPARLLVHLLTWSGRRPGALETATSERALVDELSFLGDGWSRGPLAASMRALYTARLVHSPAKGRYRLAPELISDRPWWSERGPGSQPPTDHGGPSAGQSGPGSQPSSPHVFPMSDVDVLSHEHDHHKPFPGAGTAVAAADLAEAEARALGVQGPVLDLVRKEPLRALCWARYAAAKAAVDTACRPAALVNSMLHRGPATWPGGTHEGSAVRLHVAHGRAEVVTTSGVPWSPLVKVSTPGPVSASPAVDAPWASLRVVNEALENGPRGRPWTEDPEFCADREEARSALRATGLVPAYLEIVACHEALKKRGILTGHISLAERPDVRRAAPGSF